MDTLGSVDNSPAAAGELSTDPRARSIYTRFWTCLWVMIWARHVGIVEQMEADSGIF